MDRGVTTAPPDNSAPDGHRGSLSNAGRTAIVVALSTAVAYGLQFVPAVALWSTLPDPRPGGLAGIIQPTAPWWVGTSAVIGLLAYAASILGILHAARGRAEAELTGAIGCALVYVMASAATFLPVPDDVGVSLMWSMFGPFWAALVAAWITLRAERRVQTASPTVACP